MLLENVLAVATTGNVIKVDVIGTVVVVDATEGRRGGRCCWRMSLMKMQLEYGVEVDASEGRG